MADMPKLTLYNTLTRQKEVFRPEDPKSVRMYVCGPTVYDYAHIGNARPVIVFDVLYRLLRHIYGSEHVTYVRNITDVDDKINARAAKEGVDIRALTEHTAEQFHKDVAALGCLPPTVEPRATDHIDEMIVIIQALLDKQHAYLADGAEGAEVLFDTATMADYGQLSNRKLEDQREGARIAVEAHKHKAADFVLWKQSNGNDPGWDATFTLGQRKVSIFGRPGWHIECSAMSEKYLGQIFDIHGGGIDLVFPHHENEIAQSRCAHGTPVMARYWLHNGFLQVEGQKMSKSLGNFITINQLLETTEFGGRKWPGEVIRLAMLKTHYRQPIDWTMRALEEAEANLDKWAAELGGASAEVDYDLVDREVFSHIYDDLNTPLAIAALHQLSKPSSRLLVLTMLGIDLECYERDKQAAGNSVDDEQRAHIGAQILARLAARKAKNWAEADRIRDELAAQGIQLKDSKDPDTGEIVTTWEVTG